jgi:hypothetical protein
MSVIYIVEKCLHGWPEDEGKWVIESVHATEHGAKAKRSFIEDTEEDADVRITEHEVML